jgi:hypothetical protein
MSLRGYGYGEALRATKTTSPVQHAIAWSTAAAR